MPLTFLLHQYHADAGDVVAVAQQFHFAVSIKLPEHQLMWHLLHYVMIYDIMHHGHHDAVNPYNYYYYCWQLDRLVLDLNVTVHYLCEDP